MIIVLVIIELMSYRICE